LILDHLQRPPDLDATAWAERSTALGERITAYLVSVLRPEWHSPPGEGDAMRYDDEKLPPERRWEITAQLRSLLVPGFAELASGDSASAETVWAAILTDIVLNEIGQDLLDSPIVYAGDIARAAGQVSAYLRAASAAGRDQGEEALSRASSDILALIVQEACPYYLFSAPHTGEAGSAVPDQEVSSEQES
jgi:hypothetical protein